MPVDPYSGFLGYPEMSTGSIILSTLNARYSHPSLGLRYLKANMGELSPQTVLREFLIQDDPLKVAEELLELQAAIVGFSISIWNITQTLKVITILKQIAPTLHIVTGGPELRYADSPPPGVDVLIRGEGELLFPEICRRLLAGETPGPVVDAGIPNLQEINLPYSEYSDEDLAQRIIYVESSRGCPFRCEFCLSAREEKVRSFNLDRLLPAFEKLIDRGCRSFKFIDRTFNLDWNSCERILNFFFGHWPRTGDGKLVPPANTRQVGQGAKRNESFFLHFEVVPDRFDDRLLASLARFPAGGIQLEMGVQTLNPAVGERISRKVNPDTTALNLRRIKTQTGVHVHADLIIGLPGEDSDGFSRSYDKLRGMGPDEIQIGILKLLPGAPIVRHVENYRMLFNPQPPYEVLQTDCISFPEMQRLKRLARYHDAFVNSGKFSGAMAIIMDSGESAFRSFGDFSVWVYRNTGQDYAISQNRQYALVLEYLLTEKGLTTERATEVLKNDFLKNGNPRYLPEVLRTRGVLDNRRKTFG